jgi:NAD(P)-dependent dehydrogenase (short-subunit alcohol dehydrogenase family)
MQTILVTGASTGIGWAASKLLIEKGFRVFGSLRSAQDAARLSAEFGAAFVPLLFDVTDELKVQAAAQQVREQLNGETLFGLVNNAGIAVPAPLLLQPIAEFRMQIEVNLIGQLIVTQAFLPLLGADRTRTGPPGRIVNVSSSSGKSGSPFLGAYSASKFALEGLSESLRRELMLYGIDVIIVSPGPIATPIWDKANQVDLNRFQGSEYLSPVLEFQKYAVTRGKKGLPAEKVAQVILRALTSRNPRVRYAVEPGNPLVNLIQEWLPKRVIDGIIAASLGLKRR